MSGEMRLVRSGLLWGSIAVPPAAGLVFVFRGAAGAASVLIAAAVVLANAAIAGAISALAGRWSATAAAFAALPSFAVRMMLILSALTVLRPQPFIDAPTFAFTFVIAVIVVLAAESHAWRRTPWIGLTLKETS